MFVRLLLLLACFVALGDAAIALYLADGAEMSVREYEVVEDRVRYYSLERSQWEEIPLDLVDIAKKHDRQNADIHPELYNLWLNWASSFARSPKRCTSTPS